LTVSRFTVNLLSMFPRDRQDGVLVLPLRDFLTRLSAGEVIG